MSVFVRRHDKGLQIIGVVAMVFGLGACQSWHAKKHFSNGVEPHDLTLAPDVQSERKAPVSEAAVEPLPKSTVLSDIPPSPPALEASVQGDKSPVAEVDDPSNINDDSIAGNGKGLSSLPIQESFSMCMDSMYMQQWEKDFEIKWMADNASKYKKRARLKSAFVRARSQAYLSLIYPSLQNTVSDFPLTVNGDVIRWIHFFQSRGRGQFATWLRRGETVIPNMGPVLRERGLPEDLVYLAMMESGFNDRAYSFARASGAWQIMKGTGREQGLRIDDYVDARRDSMNATMAAARYLSTLYNDFGDWYLAAAAYNAGPGRIRKAIKKGHGEKDYWTLAEKSLLPKETKDYVPKILAAILIAKNQSFFGFGNSAGTLNRQQQIAAAAPRHVPVKLARSVALSDLSKATGIETKVLEHLNPELRFGVTPPQDKKWGEEYFLKVPAAQESLVAAVLEDLPAPAKTRNFIMRLPRTQKLVSIAKKIGISLKELLSANPGLKPSSQVVKGTALAIPVRLGTGQIERLAQLESPPSRSKFRGRHRGRHHRKVAELKLCTTSRCGEGS